MSNEKDNHSREAAQAARGGCLPFVLACVILASLGVCGPDCQQDTLDGIRATSKAIRGEEPTP